MDFNSFIKLMKVIFIGFLAGGWPGLAVWGIFKFTPVTSENWWLFYLSVLVILSLIFYTIKTLGTYDQPEPHSFWDKCALLIGTLPLQIFFLVDGYFNPPKNTPET